MLAPCALNVYSKRRLDQLAKPLRYSNNNKNNNNITILFLRRIFKLLITGIQNTHCSANNYDTYTILNSIITAAALYV